MKGDAITQARFVDYARVATRNAFKLIFEIPLENADKALEVLGGTPVTGKEKWCALALLDPALFEKKGQAEQQPEAPAPSPEKVPHKSSKLSVEAFWMCRRRDFQEWLGVSGEDAADARVKSAIRIMSKTALDHNRDAAQRWHDLVAEFHRATMPQEPAA